MTPSTDCLIRTFERSDVPAVATLVREFAGYLRTLGDVSEVQLDTAALERDGFGADPAFGGVVAEIAGEVVGYLLHHPGYDTDAACRLLFVVDLYVTERVRGRGVGAALMYEARAIAEANGARQVVWTIDERNALARDFYLGIGAYQVEGLELMCLDVLAPSSA